MAIYHTQRLFSKKSNKVAGHAVGATIQGAVSGALLRDALKTKSNLSGAGAVLAGTAAALHTAEAIKAARKKGKEFSGVTEKTFNSKAQKLLRAKHELSAGIRATVGTPAAPHNIWKSGETWSGALETNRHIGRRIVNGKTPMFEGKALFSAKGDAIKALRKSKKAAKKAWENAGADAVLVGPRTKGQFRKINASGTTLTKHELKRGIGVAIKDGEKHIYLAPSSTTNHSINSKGIEDALGYNKNEHMGLAKRLHNDPEKGTNTHIWWK